MLVDAPSVLPDLPVAVEVHPYCFFSSRVRCCERGAELVEAGFPKHLPKRCMLVAVRTDCQKHGPAVDPMVRCMTGCGIDTTAGCRSRVLSCNLDMQTAEIVAVAGIDAVGLGDILAAGSPATEPAVAAVRKDLDSDCHGLRVWNRLTPKGCDQPFCESR